MNKCGVCGKDHSEHILSEEVEKILDDIDSGKTKMKTSTVEEFLKELKDNE